jgi:hypothetical protein
LNARNKFKQVFQRLKSWVYYLFVF